MKVGIVGSRGFHDYDLMDKVMSEIKKRKEITGIVSGGAKGADSLGVKWAKENGFDGKTIEIFLPDWDKYGKSAGYKRNVLIVEASDIIVAFWDGKSRGTEHTINITKEEGKYFLIVFPDGKVWSNKRTKKFLKG